MIQVKNLSFRYQGAASAVLDDLNLTMYDNEWVVISGESGCGKSTLGLALAGFLGNIIPGELTGEILINGDNIREIPMNEISRSIFLVQQNPENQFCTLTVRDELAFGLENRCVPVEEIKVRISEALKAVKAESLIDRKLGELSGGQQQKAAIATALALKPDILILDEPTSNLDLTASGLLFETLSRLQKEEQLTILIIEHRAWLLEELCTRHLVMQDGRLFEAKKDKTYQQAEKSQEKQNSRRNKSNETLLELKDHTVLYEDQPVLHLDSLQINQGEITSLMGPNGSGKTSLLLSLLGLVDSKSLSKVFFGKVIEGRLTRDVMRNFGLVFQNPDHQLFCDSVREEVYYGPENYFGNQRDEDWINRIISKFQFLHFQDQQPYLLSYGQKGRLNLASVLSFKPQVLLLDEIFIGQDMDHVIFLLKTIQDYVRQNSAAAVIVNHLPCPVLNYADRFVFLEGGEKVVDCGMAAAKHELAWIGQQAYLPEEHA